MRHWLFKTEPTTFSARDLAAKPERTTCWDGVRNYQARNFMREMQTGDLGILYHSGGEPGAVAVVEVVREAYPDHTQFEPENAHFDPKSSPESPRWDMVDIRLTETLARPVGLARMRAKPELAEMMMLRKGSRLSVTPLTAGEFEIIRNMSREDAP